MYMKPKLCCNSILKVAEQPHDNQREVTSIALTLRQNAQF